MNRPVRVSILITLLYASLAAAEHPTKIVFFQAYTQGNVMNPNLIVAQRYSGTCWTRSIANPGRPDAWRCQASNMILDPCFEDGTSLACVVSPWTHKAAILELNTPLYKKNSNQNTNIQSEPWAMELENGQRCTFLTGASTVINQQRVNYSCENYDYIIGRVDRSSSTWKVNLYDFDTKAINKVAISTVWF